MHIVFTVCWILKCLTSQGIKTVFRFGLALIERHYIASLPYESDGSPQEALEPVSPMSRSSSASTAWEDEGLVIEAFSFR